MSLPEQIVAVLENGPITDEHNDADLRVGEAVGVRDVYEIRMALHALEKARAIRWTAAEIELAEDYRERLEGHELPLYGRVELVSSAPSVNGSDPGPSSEAKESESPPGEVANVPAAVLAFLRDAGGVFRSSDGRCTAHLAEQLGLASWQNLSGVLHTLEKSGQIARDIDREARRTYAIALPDVPLPSREPSELAQTPGPRSGDAGSTPASRSTTTPELGREAVRESNIGRRDLPRDVAVPERSSTPLDREVDAIALCALTLERLDASEAQRVVGYLILRFGAPTAPAGMGAE